MDKKTEKELVTRKVQLQAFMFNHLTIPDGFLDPHPGCQGLWYYVILMKMRIQKEKDNSFRYEDEFKPFIVEDHKGLFVNIAMLYAVTPEVMNTFWSFVDMQCTMMGSPKLPPKYRFDFVPNVETRRH